MITKTTADPIALTGSAPATYRARPGAGERSLLPQGTRPAPNTAGDGGDGAFLPQRPPAEPLPEPESYGAGSMFAAAVIAGAMPPAPTSMEELIMRIGSLPIPPESEARLKDLLA